MDDNDILNATINFKDLINLISNKEIKKTSLKNCYDLFIKQKTITNREGTVRYYRTNLIPVINYLQTFNILDTNQINNDVLNLIVVHYVSRNNKAVSINKKVTCLIYMLEFVSNLGIIDKPNLQFKRLKESQPKISVIDDETMNRIIKYVNKLSLKSKVLFYLMLSTGIRLNELCHIKTNNIDFHNESIYLDFTKTGVARTIYIDAFIISMIKDYIDKNTITGEYLFTNSNEPLKQNTFKLLIKRIKKALNIELSATRLRHYFGTTLLKSGCDIKTTSVLMGHTNIKTTSRYLDVTDNELKNKSHKFGPLNKINNLS